MPPYVEGNECDADAVVDSFATFDVMKQSLRSDSEPKKKHGVSFSRKVKVKRVKHINDIKRQLDISDIWFSEIELIAIRSECRDIVKYMNSIDGCVYGVDNKQQEEGQSINIEDGETRMCTRGLEKFTKLERDVRQIRKENAVMVVLEEQEYQRSRGILEPEVLAHLYKLTSCKCQHSARITGLKDFLSVYRDNSK